MTVSTLTRAALLCTTALLALPAAASPVTVNGPYLLVDTKTTNSLNFPTGEQIGIGADATPSGWATTAIAQTSDLSNGATVTETVPWFGGSADPNGYRVDIPYNANLTGPWTLTFTNGTDTTTVMTPSIVGVTPAPFANSITMWGTGLYPSFAWSYPGSLDGVTFLLYDKSTHAAGGGADLIYSHSMPGNTTTFTLPSPQAGGPILNPNDSYVADFKGLILRNPAGPRTNANTAAQSQTYVDFFPTSSAVPLNLPTTLVGGGYQYSMPVIPGFLYYLDPAIATGYVFDTGAGNPNFASVLLPAIQSAPYDLSFLDNGMTITDLVDPGVVFDFPAGGVTSFQVTGIDPSLGLDPSDTTAFVTGVTFEGDGMFTGTQTPIVSAVPEPSAFLLLGAGLLGLGAVRCSRRHIGRW